MNLIKHLWYRLLGDPTPIFEYCNVCHRQEALPGTHLCFGPLLCEGCGEEIILESPIPGVFPNIWGHVPCPARNKEE